VVFTNVIEATTLFSFFLFLRYVTSSGQLVFVVSLAVTFRFYRSENRIGSKDHFEITNVLVIDGVGSNKLYRNSNWWIYLLVFRRGCFRFWRCPNNDDDGDYFVSFWVSAAATGNATGNAAGISKVGGDPSIVMSAAVMVASVVWRIFHCVDLIDNVLVIYLRESIASYASQILGFPPQKE